MPKLIKIILILFLIPILILVFLRNDLCRFLIFKVTAENTGLKISIERLNLNILNSSLSMQGITLFNPPGFEEEALGKIKELFMQYNLWALLRGKLHFRQINTEISEVNIITNKEGISNVAAFKKKPVKEESLPQPPQSGSGPASASHRKTKSWRSILLIEKLTLSVKKVSFINHKARGRGPAVVVFRQETPFFFKDINDMQNVIDLVAAEGGYKGLLDNILQVRDALKNAAKSIKDKVKEMFPRKNK